MSTRAAARPMPWPGRKRRMDAGRPTDPPPMADSREVEGRAAAWLARRDGAGDAWSDADAAALEAWLASAAAHRVAFLRLESAWEQAGRLQALAAGMAPGVPERGRWTGQSPSALLAGAPLVPRVTAPTDTTPTAG